MGYVERRWRGKVLQNAGRLTNQRLNSGNLNKGENLQWLQIQL